MIVLSEELAVLDILFLHNVMQISQKMWGLYLFAQRCMKYKSLSDLISKVQRQTLCDDYQPILGLNIRSTNPTLNRAFKQKYQSI